MKCKWLVLVHSIVILSAVFLLSWPASVEAVTGDASLDLPGMNAIPVELSLDTAGYTLSGVGNNVWEIKSSIGEISKVETKLNLSGRWDPLTRIFTATVSGEQNVTNQDQFGEEYGSSRIIFTGKLSGNTKILPRISGTGEVTITSSSAKGTVGKPYDAGTVNTGEFNISLKGESFAVAEGVLLFPFQPFHARIRDVIGDDVEVSLDGGKVWQTAKPNQILHEGDYVRTGYESGVSFWFYDMVYLAKVIGELEVPPLTQFRIDSSLRTKEGLEKTQLNLLVGAVKARIKHVPGIRSDFSVSTPTANASIRGSEMMVVADESGATTIYAIEDTTYFTPVTGGEEQLLQESFKVEVATDGSVSVPSTFSATEISSDFSEIPFVSQNGGKQSVTIGKVLIFLGIGVMVVFGALHVRKK